MWWLPLLLVLLLTGCELAPESCPPGTTLRTLHSEIGDEAWCSGPLGERHGPYRRTVDGELVEVGAYRLDRMDGTWIEWRRGGYVELDFVRGKPVAFRDRSSAR